MKAYTLNLPFSRWWNNHTEDVPWEHIEEMATTLNLEWNEIEAGIINSLSPRQIVFYSNTFWVNENQIIKMVDDNDTYYYIFDSCEVVENKQNNLIYQVHYELDEWMSHELYRLQNNMYNETRAKFINKTHDRYIQRGSKGMHRKDISTWTIDFINQPYLMSPNTSIKFSTESIKQSINFDGDDISEKYCFFRHPLNLDALDHMRADHFWPTAFEQKALIEATLQNTLAPMQLGELPPVMTIADHIYRVTPNGEYTTYLEYGAYFKDGRVTHTPIDDFFWGEAYECLIHQDWLASQNFMLKWKDIDDFFNLERLADGSSNPDVKRYQYGIYKILPDASGTDIEPEDKAMIQGKRWEKNGDTWTINDFKDETGNYFMLLPLIDNNYYNREVEYKYWKPGKLGNWTAEGKIINSTRGISNDLIFETIVKNNFKVSNLKQNIETSVSPSQLVQFLSKPNPDGTDNNTYAYLNRAYLPNSEGETELTYGMNLIPPATTRKTLNTFSNPQAAFTDPKYWAADFCPFFIGNITEVVEELSDLQNKNIKFFNDFRKLLTTTNDNVNRAPKTIPENEPLLYCPLFFNLRHVFQNDGRGTLYPDMIEWENLFQLPFSEIEPTGHVDIVNLAANTNPAYSNIYRWDIETCINKNFGFSPSREELIYTDKRQFITNAPNTYTDKMNSTAFNSAGMSDSVSGITKDAADTAYKSGMGLHDANVNADWVQRHQASLGKNFEKASFNAKKDIYAAKSSAIFGASKFVMKNALSIPSIFSQRASTIQQARSYTIPPFSADILLGGENKSLESLWNKAWFETVYLKENNANALFSYHAAYGYHLDTNLEMNEIMNRQQFNYFILDSSWNKTKIINDSLDGIHSLTPFYRTIENGQEWIDRLSLGFRIHNTKFNNFQPFDLDSEDNGEIWLHVELIGDDLPWYLNDQPSSREYTIKIINEQYPDKDYELSDYIIDINIILDDKQYFSYIAEGSKLTLYYNPPAGVNPEISNTIDIFITNAIAPYPYKHCFLANAEFSIAYDSIGYHMDGDYSDWEIILSSYKYILIGDYSEWKINLISTTKTD